MRAFTTHGVNKPANMTAMIKHAMRRVRRTTLRHPFDLSSSIFKLLKVAAWLFMLNRKRICTRDRDKGKPDTQAGISRMDLVLR